MVLLPRFYGADLVTGLIIEELPDLLPTSALSRIVNAYTGTSFSLPLVEQGSHGAPPSDWKSATEVGRSMIVVTLGEQPIWAGAVLERRGGTAGTATIACATLEAYLDRRFVETHDFNQQDEASVIAFELIGDGNDVEGIDLDVDAPATGMLRDREYFSYDDKTVYEALNELADLKEGTEGIEWTIDIEWADPDHTAFSKIVRVRDRIGVAAPASGPAAVFDNQAASIFDSGGDIDVRYEVGESYVKGKGANHVIAVSSGQGDVRPESAPARDEDLFAAGWPRWELRFSPSTSISLVETLNEHASARLARVARGARTLTLTARADVYPRLGDNWFLGDDIGYRLVSLHDPDGIEGVARAAGWELDLAKNLVSPKLVLPGQDGEGA